MNHHELAAGFRERATEEAKKRFSQLLGRATIIANAFMPHTTQEAETYARIFITDVEAPVATEEELMQ